MSQESSRSTDVLAQYVADTVNPALAPLYELTEVDQSRIINRLANLLIGTVVFLRDTGQPQAAASIARRASDILADYDPDVADLVRRRGFTQPPQGLPDDPGTANSENPARR